MQIAHVVTTFDAVAVQGFVLAIHLMANMAYTPVFMRVLGATQFMASLYDRVTIARYFPVVMAHFSTFVWCGIDWARRLCCGKTRQGDKGDSCKAVCKFHVRLLGGG